MTNDADIAIIGGGLVGLTAALACAHKGASVILIDRDDPAVHLKAEFDGRASAIAASSFEMYRHLGVSDHLDGHIQSIHDILISDGDLSGGVSPLTLHFDSQDAGGAPMGYMMENRRLRAALLAQIKANAQIEIIAPASVDTIEESPGCVQVHLDDNRMVSAAILIAADGRHSFCRRQAGIGVDLLPYDQKAIVTTVRHELPHNGVAHELFLPSGPFAILPLTENRSSIVWSDSPGAVDAAMALPEDAFLAELARRFGDLYGELELCAPRWAYPLSLQMAEQYVSGRMALIGDAAHAIHPIAGQGLNMGLRDAAVLADVVMEARQTGQDLTVCLPAYALWRNSDNRILAGATDILNRFFSNNIAPIKHLRRLGLGLMDQIKPAQAFFIREAAGQLGELPTLLRPDY